MDCNRIEFSGHAVVRMYERGLSPGDIRLVVAQGEVIADYPNDSPYPSVLLLGQIDGRPLHIVVAQNPTDEACIVVTAYVPDPAKWSADFRERKAP